MAQRVRDGEWSAKSKGLDRPILERERWLQTEGAEVQLLLSIHVETCIQRQQIHVKTCHAEIQWVRVNAKGGESQRNQIKIKISDWVAGASARGHARPTARRCCIQSGPGKRQ